MKNKFFAFGAAALLLASCSSDDDSSIDYNQLNKKWYFVSDRVNGETIPYDDHETCGKDYLEFMSNGTARNVDVWGCEGGVQEDVSEFDYVRDGNVISIVGFDQEARIQKLTSSTMELKVVYDWDDDGDEETVIEKYTSNPN